MMEDLLKKEIEEIKKAKKAKRITEDSVQKFVKEKVAEMEAKIRKELGL